MKKKIEAKKPEEVLEKKQIKNENRILRNLLLIIGVTAFVFVGYLVLTYFMSSFTYEGVEFKVLKDDWAGILYNAKVPVSYQGQKTDYNFYLRNDPRKIGKEIPFDGNLYIRPSMVINSTAEITCNGDGVIALANLVNLYKILGTDAVQDANATCDSDGRYVHINIQDSDKTSIEEVAPACFVMNINNCEILEATERYMLETFIEIQDYLVE